MSITLGLIGALPTFSSILFHSILLTIGLTFSSIFLTTSGVFFLAFSIKSLAALASGESHLGITPAHNDERASGMAFLYSDTSYLLYAAINISGVTSAAAFIAVPATGDLALFAILDPAYEIAHCINELNHSARLSADCLLTNHVFCKLLLMLELKSCELISRNCVVQDGRRNRN